LSSVPTTQKEKTDCAILLSPSQLFKIVVGKIKKNFIFFNFTKKKLFILSGPPELNFGEVCVNAPITKFLSVLNNLDQFILVQIDVYHFFLFFNQTNKKKNIYLFRWILLL